MNLTDNLKGWLVEHMGISETASDEEFLKALGEAIAAGKVPDEVLAEAAQPKSATEDVVKAVSAAVAEGIEPLSAKIDATNERVEEIAGEVDELKAAADKPKPQGDADSESRLEAKFDKLLERMAPREETPRTPPDSKVTPTDIFNPAGSDGADTTGTMPNVKAVTTMFSGTKKALFYPDSHEHFPGRAAKYGLDASPLPLPKGIHAASPMHLESASELDHAICAAYFKRAARANNPHGIALPRWLRWTDLDEQIWQHAIHEEKWTGIVGRGSSDDLGAEPDSQNVVYNAKLTDWQQKALLDDSTSGGLEAAPIVFDAAVITTPVLFGELFPLVSVVPITRGRRVEGFSVSNPNFTSGTAEGTAISLFSTDSMIAAFDTTIYNAVGAIEVGQDFEQDSPVAIGALIVQRYGDKAREWLDNQIANGDGTSEPQGVFNASGITDIGNPAGGANAAPQPDDYISLWGNVAKQYRPPADRARSVFIGSDTSYRRAKTIAVGENDERRVYGMNLAEYALHEIPFKVQNDISNTYCGFFNLRYYRMYRRLGLTVRVETGGKELARKNLTLIVVRMRWGGKLELGGAGSYSDNWQT